MFVTSVKGVNTQTTALSTELGHCVYFISPWFAVHPNGLEQRTNVEIQCVRNPFRKKRTNTLLILNNFLFGFCSVVSTTETEHLICAVWERSSRLGGSRAECYYKDGFGWIRPDSAQALPCRVKDAKHIVSLQPVTWKNHKYSPNINI